MAKEMIKLFYGFGVLIIVISLGILWKTATQMVPMYGMDASAQYLGMSILFLVLGIGIIGIGIYNGRKHAARERAEREQEQQ